MLIVSENMIYYSLDKNLDGNRILEDIQRLLNKFDKKTLESSVLVVKIQQVSDYKGDSLLPKLSHTSNKNNLQ